VNEQIVAPRRRAAAHVDDRRIGGKADLPDQVSDSVACG